MKLTEEQFIALTTLMRCKTTSKAYAAAYDVMVEGHTITESAQRNLLNYNQTWSAVQRVKGAYELAVHVTLVCDIPLAPQLIDIPNLRGDGSWPI